MKDFGLLKTQIAAAIRENSSGAITGSVLQDQLLAIVGKMELSCFEGFATPSTTAVADTSGEHFYIAVTAGTYTNFGGTVLGSGDVYIFYRASGSSSWTAKQIAEGEVAVDDSTIGRNANGELMLKDGSVSLAKMTDAAKSNFATASQVTQLSSKVDDLDTASTECKEAVEGLQDELENLTPTVVEGNVTNNADNEDLEAVNGALKLRNRTTAYANKGYVILRRNASFASQVTTANTIYEIRYDFDLNKGTVEIPSGCVLRFTGGKLKNGAIVGNATVIEAGSYQIFDDTLQTYVCEGSYLLNNSYTFLDFTWSDPSERKVRIGGNVHSNINYMWKVVTSGSVRHSGADGNNTFVKVAENQEIQIDKELLLCTKPSSFKPIKLGTNEKVSVTFSSYNMNNTAYFYMNDDGKFIAPHHSRFFLFSSNNDTDDLNDTYIEPGTELDKDTTYYACYSDIVEPSARKGTFACEADLAWWVGNRYLSWYRDYANGVDVSKALQNALDSSFFSIKSPINGMIRCDKTIYIERTKKIDLGQKIFVRGEFSSNAYFGHPFNQFGTFIYTLENNDMVWQRNTIDLSGGCFNASLASSHTKDIWVCDIDYSQSNSKLETTLIGKQSSSGGYGTRYGIFVDLFEKTGGRTAFGNSWKLDILTCVYCIYCPSVTRTSNYFNGQKWDCYLEGYCQGFYINGVGGSDISFVMQSMPSCPSADVDNFTHGYLETSKSNISITNWDFATTKSSGATVKTYKKGTIKGFRNTFFGNLNSYGNTYSFWYLPDDEIGYSRPNPMILFAQTKSYQSLVHPELSSVCANYGLINKNTSYISSFKIKDGESVNLRTYYGKSNDNSGVEIVENKSGSNCNAYKLLCEGSNSYSLKNINAGCYAELFIECMDSSIPIDRDAAHSVDFLSFENESPFTKYGFTNILIIYLGKDGNVLKTKQSELNQWTTYIKIGDFTERLISGVCSVIVRLFGNEDNNWGVEKNTTNTSIDFGRLIMHATRTRGYYVDNTAQIVEAAASSSSRPAVSEIGRMMFDKSTSRPMWWNGSTWIGADSIAIHRSQGTTLQRPTLGSNSAGSTYYDSSLGKIILWNGTAWVNIDGTALA